MKEASIAKKSSPILRKTPNVESAIAKKQGKKNKQKIQRITRRKIQWTHFRIVDT